MTEIQKKQVSSDQLPKTEVDLAVEKIFTSVIEAVNKAKEQKVTLEQVDKTLEALFEVLNKVPFEGNKTKIPDFNKILIDVR